MNLSRISEIARGEVKIRDLLPSTKIIRDLVKASVLNDKKQGNT